MNVTECRLYMYLIVNDSRNVLIIHVGFIRTGVKLNRGGEKT